jgi:DNA polymerase III delta prime subunit
MSLPLLMIISAQTDTLTAVNQVLTSEFGWTGSSFDHPDIQWLNQPDETLTIERVRDLPQIVATKPMGQTRFIILTNLESASVPAQNALLKILEEPPAGNQLILVATNVTKILPTVKSRTRQLRWPADGEATSIDVQTNQALYQQLTTSSYAQLIDMAEKYSEREAAKQLLENLITYLHQQLEQTTEAKSGLRLTHHLKTLLKTQEYIDKNVNVRLALEDAFFQLKK